MTYNERLADRIRQQLAGTKGMSERKMFGGIAFMHRGNMVCGIVGDDLMVRVGADAQEDALAKPHTRPMDFTGRPSRGMVYVALEGVARAPSLRAWIDRGLSYAKTLPAKQVR